MNIKDASGNPNNSLVYGKHGNDLYIFRDNNQYTLIKNYYKKVGEETIANVDLYVNGSVDPVGVDYNADIMNLSKKNSLIIGGEYGEDAGSYILGNKNDVVLVNSGDNIINLLGGNDTVSFAAGYEEGTIIRTSGGTDNVKFAGVAGNDIDLVRDADGNIVISAGADPHATVTIKDFEDKSSTVNVKDKDNKVVATLKSGSGKINGTKGNDIIVGSAKNDTITGGDGINEIYTRGGNDTVVIGNNGFNFINATENTTDAKVTLKTNALYLDNVSIDGDNLEYADGVNNFVYEDFFNTGVETADLYATVGKTSYHVSNETEGADYSEKQDNNIVFLTSTDPEGQTYTASEKINAVFANNGAEIRYNDGSDVYYALGEHDNKYNVTVSDKTFLEIDDMGGDNDTLTLYNNSSADIRLFFNVDTDGETSFDDNGYLLYDSDSLDYNHVMAVTRGDTTGSISVIEATTDNINDRFGVLENVITLTDGYTLDMDGWKEYVSGKVQAWLTENRQTSVSDVLALNQKKAANKALVNSLIDVYKNASYANYMADAAGDLIALADKDFADLIFVKSGNNLTIKEVGVDEPLFSQDNFFTGEANDAKFFAVNNEGQVQKYSVFTVVNDAQTGEDTMTFSNDPNVVISSLSNNTTFVYDDKAYSDFYTKDDGSGNYTAGDPLIYKGGLGEGAKEGDWQKGGNGLTVGNVYIEDVSDYNGEILVQASDGTRNIIVGGEKDNENKTNVEGTFESEILIGTNGADVINASGGDDLVYSGGGDDTLNFTASAGGEATGKNTAGMIVIGGSDYMPEHTNDAISVYDASGSDTYNTTLDVGLYVEDYRNLKDELQNSDTDTINITAGGVTASDIRYMFDVYNPKYVGASSKPTFYADLFIMDTTGYNTMKTSLSTKIMGGTTYGSTSEVLESLQGSFGYVWVDDQYSASQKIENINLNGSALDVEIDKTNISTPTTSYIQTMYQAISAWLSNTTTGAGVKGGYDTAWSVVKDNTDVGKTNAAQLFAMYGMSKQELIQYAAQLTS